MQLCGFLVIPHLHLLRLLSPLSTPTPIHHPNPPTSHLRLFRLFFPLLRSCPLLCPQQHIMRVGHSIHVTLAEALGVDGGEAGVVDAQADQGLGVRGVGGCKLMIDSG